MPGIKVVQNHEGFLQYQLHASSVNGSKVMAIFQDGRHKRLLPIKIVPGHIFGAYYTNVKLSLAIFLEQIGEKCLV